MTTETTATKPAETPSTFGKVLGCDEKAAGARLDFLGLTVTCGRCGGSGRHSYNQIDGDRCYGCGGCGRRMPKFTKKLGAHVAGLVAAGALEPYFAKRAARAAARKLISPLVAEAKAVYETIGNAYTVGSLLADECNREHNAAARANGGDGYGCPWCGRLLESPLGLAQGMNNSLFWGTYDSKKGRGDRSVCGIESAAKYGDIGPEAAVAALTETLGYLVALRDAWLAI